MNNNDFDENGEPNQLEPAQDPRIRREIRRKYRGLEDEIKGISV